MEQTRWNVPNTTMVPGPISLKRIEHAVMQIQATKYTLDMVENTLRREIRSPNWRRLARKRIKKLFEVRTILKKDIYANEFKLQN